MLVLALAGCRSEPAVQPVPPTSTPAPPDVPIPSEPATPTPTQTQTLAPPTPAASTPTPPPPTPARPDWLGTRVLPLRADGFGEIQPTPPELRDRRLPPSDPGPPQDDAFAATVGAVPAEVAARSTWSPACPVALEDLRHLTLTFWGFDGRPHAGELLVNAAVADDVVAVFRHLYEARFPLEEVRIIAPAELDLPPTGDGNATSSFVCRPVRTGTRWSEHAYGLAIDINPFHNPYVRGDLVLPELASAYLDRADQRPGMVLPGGPVTEAFAAIGWGWGGDWHSLRDSMHFSANGR